ncbi:MAG: helix-turn-helix transcriptional regulator [Lachnospiraceae bacterium]
MSRKISELNIALSKDYLEPSLHATAHIIVPDNLPIKISVMGVRTIINVGEFCIIPPGCVFAIHSSPERYCLDFDFSVISSNPEFTILIPIITKPCVYHPVNTESGFNEGYTTWYTQYFQGNSASVAADTTLQTAHQSYSRVYPVTQSYAAPQPAYHGYPAPSANNIRRFHISPIDIIKELINALRENSLYFPDSLAVARLFELYSMLGEEIIANGFHGRHETIATPAILEKLAASIRYITSNYNSEINLDAVAETAGYSRTHYSKSFKEFYGISFYDYLLQVRVNTAAKLLTETSISISGIMEAAGFSSSSTFNRVFKQETGYSPREYRNLFCAENP